jgi:hypothetical protein
MNQRRPAVLARLRPASRSSPCPLSVAGSTVTVPAHGVSFPLTAVLDNGCSQEKVYGLVQPVVASSIDGMNATVFSYGQTGSGKTFTLIGSKEQPGIVPRVCQQMEQAMHSNSTLAVSVSMVRARLHDCKFERISPFQQLEQPFAHAKHLRFCMDGCLGSV